jgi:hypothetical protein
MAAVDTNLSMVDDIGISAFHSCVVVNCFAQKFGATRA